MNKYWSILLILLVIAGCKKVDLVGLEIQPTEDLLNALYTDTVSIQAITIRADSLRTDNNAVNRSLLGDFKDPLFGRSQASIVAQLLLSSNTPSFGTNPILDSAVLILPYTGYYGDTNSTLTVQVKELEEAINADSAYYSNRIFKNKGVLLGSKTFKPRSTDSITIAAIRAGKSDTIQRIPAQLRIKLDSTFASTNLLNISTDKLASSTAFLTYFKGISINIDSNATQGTGGVCIFDMFTSGRAKVTLYYRSGADTLSFDYVINNGGAVAGTFTHNYTGSPVSAELQNPSMQQTYVQAMAGLRTKLNFPQLKHLTDSGMIAISKAELVVPIQISSNSTYKEIPRLALVRGDSTGTVFTLPDLALGDAFAGGFYNATAGTYTFNIALYLQDVLAGKRKLDNLYLVATGAATTANRSILNGTQNSAPIKLNLFYNKLY